ncbi:DUF317 domain-containing protein [Streptomyces sp. NPDC056716]|uniref:DUF317 domain-containing protein n=1 Tax=unclassified Streptomyces TaxID=2593676 RepID=UPI0036AB63E5
MTTTSVDAHVVLDTHPDHPSAVTATITGTQTPIPHTGLEAADWIPVAENVLVLARIDGQEPYLAAGAARHLAADGVTVEITPRLREAIARPWIWAHMHRYTHTESDLRDLCNTAQEIHDDIHHGRLLIHAHGQSTDANPATLAVGTYVSTGKSVHLRGQDHLRQITSTFDSPAQALRLFEQLYGDVRLGSAPLTDTELETARARTTLALHPPRADCEPPQPESVPVYAADPGDHDALLDTFLTTHDDWDKWRTWDDDTTHAIHESQTLRIERIHDTPRHQTAWIVAAYESPVSERIWVLTATGATPAPVLKELLDLLAEGRVWDTAVSTTVTEEIVTASTQPLTDAGWTHTLNGRWIRWTAPDANAGVQFDAFTAQRPHHNLSTWTIWAGPDPDHPTWTLTASPGTPSTLLADLSETLAHTTGTRLPPAEGRAATAALGGTPPAPPAPQAGRTR